MTPEIERQIGEVQDTYKGLIHQEEADGSVRLTGLLAFEAEAPNLPVIADEFEVVLSIPADYPHNLPTVRETAGKIDPDFEHLYPDDKSFCLAVPVEVRRIFAELPTLKGFIDLLVVPFLYSYCHRKQYGTYPFGDRAHGSFGIVQFYREKCGTDDDFVVLGIVAYLFEHGYRGHHQCPCRSGKPVRQCHAEILRTLFEFHTKETLYLDMNAAIDVCAELMKSDEAHRSRLTPLVQKQVSRILNGKRPAHW